MPLSDPEALFAQAIAALLTDQIAVREGRVVWHKQYPPGYECLTDAELEAACRNDVQAFLEAPRVQSAARVVVERLRGTPVVEAATWRA